jgi:toxin ParE1/3/4
LRRVIWSAHGRADFERQLAFTAAQSPRAAQSLSDAILGAVELLKENNVGRPSRTQDWFEKPVRKQPYIILYEWDEREVRVLRIVHMARDWPHGAPPPD